MAIFAQAEFARVANAVDIAKDQRIPPLLEADRESWTFSKRLIREERKVREEKASPKQLSALKP
ncbi:MAG: hypothetical protein OJF55_000665 [Rhodanobacteraceae bacterium]|jgi:hypothetical protein|nr:MAG: hypothetical protein OJF55_000665 [Rhodanobacteraceae bacterium]